MDDPEEGSAPFGVKTVDSSEKGPFARDTRLRRFLPFVIKLRDLLRWRRISVQQGGDQQVGLGTGLALFGHDGDDGFDDPDRKAPGLTLRQAQTQLSARRRPVAGCL